MDQITQRMKDILKDVMRQPQGLKSAKDPPQPAVHSQSDVDSPPVVTNACRRKRAIKVRHGSRSIKGLARQMRQLRGINAQLCQTITGLECKIDDIWRRKLPEEPIEHVVTGKQIGENDFI